MATKSESAMGHSNSHAIQLTAELVHGEVKIGSDVGGPMHLERDSGPHRFTFHLQDRTFPAMGVRFCTVEEGVLDIDESTDCPPKNRGINTDQVDPDSLISNDKMAAFTDNNSGRERTLSYALHFKCDDPGQNPIYDPEIRNGGGTTSPVVEGPSAFLIALAVIAVVALIAAIFWLA